MCCFFATGSTSTPAKLGFLVSGGVKNWMLSAAISCLESLYLALSFFSFSSFCIALPYFKHFLALFWPPDFKQKVQTRQFAFKFNLGLKFGAESLIHRRGKRQAK